MRIRNFLIVAAVALSASFAAADSYDFVIPAAGTGAGANGSQWQSEVSLFNTGKELLLVKLSYFNSDGAVKSIDVPLEGRASRTLSDIVRNDFGQTAGTGAIVVDTTDTLRSKLVVGSRTFNSSAAGEFGQDIPALTSLQVLGAGDTAILLAPSNAAANRFNFGVFASEATNVEWTLLRKDGSAAATKTASYKAESQTQYNSGATTFFGAEAADGDIVSAKLVSGSAWIYGSAVNQMSGDPTYVPSTRVRENLLPRVLGLDIDQDGIAEYLDANGDGVIDTALDIPTANFPVYLRVIAADPESQTLNYTIVSGGGADAFVLDSEGTVFWKPSVGLRGTSGNLVVRINDGTDSVDVTIPVNFR